jgi:hypothetical protein
MKTMRPRSMIASLLGRRRSRARGPPSSGHENGLSRSHHAESPGRPSQPLPASGAINAVSPASPQSPAGWVLLRLVYPIQALGTKPVIRWHTPDTQIQGDPIHV